jgi:hypothetical protein
MKRRGLMSELFPTKTIAIEVLSCTDPSRESEFNRWYDKFHIPDLRETPGIKGVYRYRDMQPSFGELAVPYKNPAGDLVRYLTVYRIDSDDPWGLMQKVKEDDRRGTWKGKMIDCLQSYEVTVWDFVAYRRTVSPLQRPETRLPDGMPEAILLIFVTTDPTKMFEHNDWWVFTHAHDLLETPGMVQCHRYKTLNPKPAEGEATNLHIYEIDSDNPVAVLQRVVEDDRDIRKPQGRFISGGGRAKSYGRGLYLHWDLM